MIVFTKEVVMLLIAFSSLGYFKGALAKPMSGSFKFAPEYIVIRESLVKSARTSDKMVKVAFLNTENIGKINPFNMDRLFQDSEYQSTSHLGKISRDLEGAMHVLKGSPRGKRYISQRPRPCLFKICSLMGKRPHPRPNNNI